MRQKKRLFAESYAVSGNASEAAKSAGYSERTAYQAGYRLSRDPEVQEYIAALRSKIQAESIADTREVLETWTKILRDGSAKNADRLRAGQLLEQTSGISRGSTLKKPEQDEPAATEESTNTVRLCLPVTDDDRTGFTAIQTEDGQIIPLSGHEDDTSLTYFPFTLLKKACAEDE